MIPLIIYLAIGLIFFINFVRKKPKFITERDLISGFLFAYVGIVGWPLILLIGTVQKYN